MAAHPIVVVDEELLRKISSEFQSDPRYKKSASLQLVPVSTPESKMTARDALATWESLRGILCNSDYDPNVELEKEKQRELEEETRWLRG